MRWLAKLFGSVGTVRFEGITDDDRSFTGKFQIEAIGMSKEEIEEWLKKAMWVKEGVPCKSIKIVGFLEENW